METYTLGQVIDIMKPDEIAIKIAGASGECPVEGYVYLQEGMYFDEKDYHILKSLTGKVITLAKATTDEQKGKFQIMKRKEYEEVLRKDK